MDLSQGPEAQPAVTIIVPTYRSGDGLQHVFDSIDEVTLPAGRLEVIFADDGSGDDTVERLRGFAKDRPYVQVLELENSGWPSHPRNVALERARGEYVLFMDHDDSLFAGQVRRVYEFAVEHDADVVSPKESKSDDAWWSLLDAALTNTTDVHGDGGVRRMMPMVPHKLYRRQLLLDHDIRFPEGGRFLWEDWYVNVPSYRYGKVASLVDAPMYLWRANERNTTRTFNPYDEEYWDRLDDLFVHIRTTLAGKEFRGDRNTLVRHNLGIRAVEQASRQLARLTPEAGAAEPGSKAVAQRSMISARVTRLLWRYGSWSVTRELSQVQRAQALLLRLQRLPWIRDFDHATGSLGATVRVIDAVWRAGQLHLELETRWEASDPERLAFDFDGQRVRLDLGRSLNRVLPAKLRTVGEPPEPANVALRDRYDCISWALPTEAIGKPTVTDTSVTHHTHVVIDPGTAAAGGPVPDAVFDLRVRSSWIGLRRYGGLEFDGPPAAMHSGSRQGTAYANASGMLSLDLSGRLRVPVIDACPEPGPAGPIDGFRARLTALATYEPQRVPVRLAAIPVEIDSATDTSTEQLAELADHGSLSAELTVDDGGGWLSGSAQLPPGDYTVWADRGGQVWMATRYGLTVDEQRIVHLIRR